MKKQEIKLEAEGLRVRRGAREVLRGVSFHVAAGEVYGLLGGNGVGKSTTLLTFLGFLEPAAGSVRVNGRSVVSDVQAARRAIAYLPESASLYPHLNARENLRYFLELGGAAVDEAAMEAALDQTALRVDARDQRLGDYSKGMRQKVAIALAILRDTSTLLLDEPTSGLDPGAIDEFHDLVRSLADGGKSVLMVTHDVYGACHVADRIGLLRDGELVGEFAAQDQGRIDTEAVHRAFTARDAA
ncbi:MAG: ABC transporter ATP-binding protein [Halieaceae bacterium]|jgi:ABC-2 type transport system ATP-binding protein|nr:ABC transporter ATP-binding protein [Halieaceae bacterium]